MQRLMRTADASSAFPAADLSAERNAPVELPLSNEAMSAIAAGARR